MKDRRHDSVLDDDRRPKRVKYKTYEEIERSGNDL